MADVIQRGLELKRKMEEEKKRKELEKNQPGFFSRLRSTLSSSGPQDPAMRGAQRTSEELRKKEEEARRKRGIIK
jgi:hypothetical protein